MTGVQTCALPISLVASVPTDAPFLPLDLVARLAAARDADGADIACAMSDGRTHPVVALWPVALRQALRRAIVEEGIRKVDAWTQRYSVVAVEFATVPFDTFFNANTPEDLLQAERLLGTMQG